MTSKNMAVDIRKVLQDLGCDFSQEGVNYVQKATELVVDKYPREFLLTDILKDLSIRYKLSESKLRWRMKKVVDGVLDQEKYSEYAYELLGKYGIYETGEVTLKNFIGGVADEVSKLNCC